MQLFQYANQHFARSPQPRACIPGERPGQYAIYNYGDSYADRQAQIDFTAAPADSDNGVLQRRPAADGSIQHDPAGGR